MSGRIPQQRTNSPEVPEGVIRDVDPICVHGLERQRCGHCCDDTPAAVAACAVEDCENPGTKRYFPTYVLTLCQGHWLVAADRSRRDRTYW